MAGISETVKAELCHAQCDDLCPLEGESGSLAAMTLTVAHMVEADGGDDMFVSQLAYEQHRERTGVDPCIRAAGIDPEQVSQQLGAKIIQFTRRTDGI